MKICIYASSENLIDLDIEKQVAACREYAAQHGYTIVAGYGDLAVDNEISRPALSWLLRASSKKKFDAVLVYSISNICASMKDYCKIRARLNRYGISIIFASTPPGSPSAQRIEQIWHFHECYRIEQSQKIHRGIQLAEERKAAQRAEMYFGEADAMKGESI